MIVTVRQVTKESTQVIGPVTMWAQPIQIQLRDKDSSLFVSATTTTDSTGATVTETPGQSDPTATPDPGTGNSGSESSGLSTGASIGIGVGIGVGALIVLAGLAFWFFRRRQTQKTTVESGSYQSGNPGPSELGGSSQAASSSTPGRTIVSELDGSNNAQKVHHELGS